MPENVIELIRVSTEGQAANDRASIPAQKAVNRRTAQAYGLEIVRSIQITDVSGAAVLYAPEMQQLIRQIASPEIHGVVAREFSRLMRPENFSDYAMLQAFAETKTVLYLPEGPIDFNNKTGRLLGTIRAAIAGLELSEIKEKMWASKEEKRRRGELAQSDVVLPWGVGYDAEKGAQGWYYKPEAERVREAYRRVLSGDHNYVALARMVGVTPRGLHLILRNPIWRGWRVIDKRRDNSAAARRSKTNGRQGDRPKMMRAAEDVIRVRVITDSLINEADWQKVQQIMDAKQRLHWRARPEDHRHYTYSGFLICGGCDDLIYTSTNRRHYYVCKKRRNGRTEECVSTWMRREKLEEKLDFLVSKRLTDDGFLTEITSEYHRENKGRESRVRMAKLELETRRLREKHQRIMDAFFDGTITMAERDGRLIKVNQDLQTVNGVLISERPQRPVSVEELAAIFEPFHEWPLLGITQKRSLMRATLLLAKVVDYQVRGISLNTPCRHEESHMGKDSSRRPA